MPRIMLIDDDETMISLLKTLLEMDGFEVISTTNWRSIPADVRASEAEVLLMDCNLPGVDGLEVLAEMRRELDFPKVHIVMTSGMDMEYKAMASGADAFLLKPYTPDTLYELIQKILES
jgi:CheY-like chemotaxis protein